MAPSFLFFFIFKLINLNGLKWTKFITLNYTDEPAVCNQEGILASVRTRAHSGVKLGYKLISNPLWHTTGAVAASGPHWLQN